MQSSATTSQTADNHVLYAGSPRVATSVPEDYYERLGVARDASESEIKAAFRDRIKETHPDVNDDDAASDRTKRLIEAKDVLTDPEERATYDRLGHEAYLSRDPAGGPANPTGDSDTNTTARDAASSTAADRQSTHETNEATGETGTGTRNRGQREQRTSTDEQATQSENWYDTSRQQRSRTAGDSHEVWDTDRSYAVGDSPGMFSLRELFTSQRTVVLLGTTFVIYPVLLFGALFQSFPTAANLVVAMCIVLVVAFLQSVPQVGMLVFGVWLVLLPVAVFGVIGVPLLSITGVLSMAAVVFPFGLSVLTWIALDPSRRYA